MGQESSSFVGLDPTFSPNEIKKNVTGFDEIFRKIARRVDVLNHRLILVWVSIEAAYIQQGFLFVASETSWPRANIAVHRTSAGLSIDRSTDGRKDNIQGLRVRSAGHPKARYRFNDAEADGSRVIHDGVAIFVTAVILNS